MPFEHVIPHPFTAQSIQTYAPTRSGVYGISNAREWIYIGETDDIQGSLAAHVRDLAQQLMKRQPTGFVYEVCDQARRPTRQDRLVREYEPALNRRVRRAV